MTARDGGRDSYLLLPSGMMLLLTVGVNLRDVEGAMQTLSSRSFRRLRSQRPARLVTEAHQLTVECMVICFIDDLADGLASLLAVQRLHAFPRSKNS